MTDYAVSHIGIAVKDLSEAIARYSLITGDDNPGVTQVDSQKAKVAIFKASSALGGPHGASIELVAPTSSGSPVARFLEKRGEGLHHVCLYVEDIEQKLAELKAAGVRLIDETPRSGAEGNKIAFVHPSGSSGVLIELEEMPK
ncbi:MAG: methylmalonyl-CoA epimerase [candidate division Zixibacteria bacterium]|nr:methylmalonyl-CoA epimerase [candidate division Zixibacteria bacterium]